MQFSKFSVQALFCVIVHFLLVTQVAAIALEQRADDFVCDVNGSANACSPADATRCIASLKGEFTKLSGNRLKFTGNYGAFQGGCRCFAECRTGQDYPSCIVTSSRVDQILNGLRDACVSSAARAFGYVYADNAKWSFARK